LYILIVNIQIDPQKVLARLGYAKGKTVVDAKTGRLLEEEMRAALPLINPKQVTAFSSVKRAGAKRLLLEPGFEIESGDIASLLRDCVKAYGIAVTIGPFLEEKRGVYIKKNETARAVILDAIGSVAAEQLAETAQKQIRQEAEQEGLAATRRFSPGYGDWPVESQEGFLKWLGAGNIGIRLNANFQMIPEKSVSAIFGVKNAHE
jgi:Vitamin B12 dependent methionine synthase, activation domain